MDSCGQRMNYTLFLLDVPATFGYKIWVEVWHIVFGQSKKLGRKMEDERY